MKMMMISNFKSLLFIYEYGSIKEIRIKREREREREKERIYTVATREKDSQFQCKRKMSYFLIGTK